MKIEPWMWADYASIYSQMLELKRARRDLVRVLRARGDQAILFHARFGTDHPAPLP